MCARKRFATVVFGVLAAWAFAAQGSAHAETIADYSFDVTYPYRHEMEAGSCAWIVTEELVKRVTYLEFEWVDAGVLLINGVKILPKRRNKEARTDDEIAGMARSFPVLAELRARRGSWSEAYSIYDTLQTNFALRLAARIRSEQEGALPRKDVLRFYRDTAEAFPYSSCYDSAVDPEWTATHFIVRRKRGNVSYWEEGPLNNTDPQQLPKTAEPRIVADAMVRQLIGHYRCNPYLPHIAVIESGGIPLLAFGESARRIDLSIEHALNKRIDASRDYPLPRNLAAILNAHAEER